MIKFLVMDVDGTLTDGKVFMGANGEAFKAFDVKDGCGIKVLLPQKGIIPVIITARKSIMLEHRCKELDISEIHQGVHEKLNCLMSVIDKYATDNRKFDLSNVAYIGDDILDLQCLTSIKNAGGMAGCPADAVSSVIRVCDFVAKHEAGKGAVREFIEHIIECNGKGNVTDDENLKRRLESAIKYITNLNYADLKVGRYDVSSDFYYTFQEYDPFDENRIQYESHHKYVDIQLVCEGMEKLYITDTNNLIPSDEYDEVRDVIHYYDSDNMSYNVLIPGSCVVLFPKDAHKPSTFMNNSSKIKKIVGKLSLQ